MTRRKRLIAGLALLICLAASSYVVVVLCTPPSAVNPSNLRRIQEGMTEKEVVDILGTPSRRNVNALAWDGDRWVADVYFDKLGLVSITSYGPQTTLLSKLRRWFAL